MTLIRFTLLFLFLIPCAIVNAASAGKRIVDLATHQEMVLYAIATDYGMIGLGVTYHDPKADISKRVADYKKNLSELLKVAPTAFSADQQKKMAGIWAEVEAAVVAPVDKAAMQKLYNNTKTLEKIFQTLAEAQAAKDHNAKEEVYVLVGELGMEGQRLAALYMMKVWGAGDAALISKEMHEVFKEVQDIFDKLEKLQEGEDAKAKAMIAKVEKDVLLLEHLVESEKSFPVLVEKSVERLMEEVEELLTYVSAFISRTYEAYVFV